jgi:hypothetical protein
MSALGIEMTSREPDVFQWQAPNTYGKPAELLAIESEIDKLWTRQLRLSDCVPLNWDEINAIDVKLHQLDAEHKRVYDEWQRSRK